MSDTPPTLEPVPFRDALRRAVAKLPKPVALRAENAFLGFEKARQLLPIDREIASFRAITAEEEASAALLKSFQMRRYPGSKRLNLYDHRHKAAVGPFIQAAKASLTRARELSINLEVDWTKPSITVRLPVSQFGINIPDLPDLHFQAVEPLGIFATHGDKQPADYFADGIEKVVAGTEYPNIRRMIVEEANQRNRLLYASDSALPASRATLEGIEMRQSRADIAVGLAIAVMQVRKPQAFAKQALQAFLRCVDCAADDQFDYGEPVPVEVDIRLQNDGPALVSFRNPEQA